MIVLIKVDQLPFFASGKANRVCRFCWIFYHLLLHWYYRSDTKWLSWYWCSNEILIKCLHYRVGYTLDMSIVYTHSNYNCGKVNWSPPPWRPQKLRRLTALNGAARGHSWRAAAFPDNMSRFNLISIGYESALFRWCYLDQPEDLQCNILWNSKYSYNW